MKLLDIKRADVKDKKWSAFFQVGDKIKKINFGAKGYGDYTLGTTDTQRKNYLARHKKDNLDTPLSSGSLSYYILWGESRNMRTNIKKFKERFNV